MTATSTGSRHAHALAKAAVLGEALPWLERFQGATVVVKYGGSTRSGDEELRNTLQDVVLLKYVGR